MIPNPCIEVQTSPEARPSVPPWFTRTLPSVSRLAFNTPPAEGLPAGAQFMIVPEKLKAVRHRYRFDFRRSFSDYMKAQGVAWISPHVMRHSFASICASKGIDIYRIATWLGDDVRVVQRHYAKLRPDDREIMKAFRV